MIGICTDSGAQLPGTLIERYGIEVVPVPITLDAVEYLEGVDLDADDFYGHFADGSEPQVSTTAPSPGRLAAAYQVLAARGADGIVSIHTGSGLSGTLDSARLASEQSPVPVRLVDTADSSFVVGCAVWAAGDALATGASAEEAATAAEQVAAHCANVFVVGTLGLAEAGGQLDPSDDPSQQMPVVSQRGDQMSTVGEASTAAAAADMMAGEILTSESLLRIGIGWSDASSQPVADALAQRLAGAPRASEVIHYRIGPSIGAYTGPGTAGAVFHAIS